MFNLIRKQLLFLKENPGFTQLASINLFSKIGDRLFYTVLLSIAATLPKPHLAITIIAISETLPLLLGIFLGSLADQNPHKPNQLIRTGFLRFALYLFIGILLNYTPTMTLILSIAAFNFLSDLLGNYSSALIAPFTKLMVQPADMPKAQSLISITSQLLSAMATFLGAYLMTIFLPKTISGLNALIFLIVAIGFWQLKAKLVPYNQQLSIQKQPSWKLIKTNFRSLVNNKPILNDLLQLALLNGSLGGLTPIYVLFLQSNAPISADTSALMISLLSATITISMIIGNSLSSICLTKISTRNLALVANGFLILLGLGFLVNQVAIIFLSVGITGSLIGIISPRFTTLVIQKYPAIQLGGIITTVNSVLVIMPPITSFIFPLLASTNSYFSYYFFIGYALVTIILNFWLGYLTKKPLH
ncbi:MFS transporter [Holzapfeliella sp. He02]|uniref:MFS transporter n=1 Tax=Holzapfeliella saturejae TaxID=3082953 RepID=A0ABU8SHK3_9LACO